jgi:hypothetical protein
MPSFSLTISRAHPDPTPIYELGRYLEGKADLVGAGRAYTEALRLDRHRWEIDDLLLQAGPQRFMTRRAMARFLSRNLKGIRQRAGTPTSKAPEDPKVFVYWEQGIEQAPPIVKACRARLREMCGPAVVELDRKSLRGLVRIPPSVRAHSPRQRAHFSDFARVALLREYGGIWVDATCLTVENLAEQFHDLTPSGFFAFRYDGARISNWFLAAQPDNYITALMHEALREYWDRRDVEVSYYFFHEMFECLYHLDERFADVWDRTVNLSAHPPHDLQRAMQEPYSADRLAELLAQSFVHKLTHKKEPDPGSIFERLLSVPDPTMCT